MTNDKYRSLQKNFINHFKLCRINTGDLYKGYKHAVESFKELNFTEEQYINLIISMCQDQATKVEYAGHLNGVIRRIRPSQEFLRSLIEEHDFVTGMTKGELTKFAANIHDQETFILLVEKALDAGFTDIKNIMNKCTPIMDYEGYTRLKLIIGDKWDWRYVKWGVINRQLKLTEDQLFILLDDFKRIRIDNKKIPTLFKARRFSYDGVRKVLKDYPDMFTMSHLFRNQPLDQELIDYFCVDNYSEINFNQLLHNTHFTHEQKTYVYNRYLKTRKSVEVMHELAGTKLSNGVGSAHESYFRLYKEGVIKP